MKKLLAICLVAVLAFAYFSKAPESAAPEPVLLGIISYNYTGRYIHTLSVNGLWGGSSGENGGGVVCCLSFKPTSKLPFTVEVEWELSDIRDFKNDKWIAAPDEPHKATVTVNGPLPKGELSNFEVHFMPDGSVQAYITDFDSSPFLLPNGKPNPDIRIVPPGDTVLPPR
jgi:Protein of unknown function (DUF3304)